MAKQEERMAEDRVEAFAEELGRVLETAQARAQDWLKQRNTIAKTLEGIRDTAVKLLQQLGRDTRPFGEPGRRSMRARSGRKRFGRTPRVMSADARERIRQAQLKRWAKQKAAEKKK
jgi:hypothetical protein